MNNSANNTKKTKNKVNAVVNKTKNKVNAVVNKNKVHFMSNESPLARKLFRFHSEVKRNLYSTYIKPGQSILEIAGGHGGDMRKIISQKPGKLVIVNINKARLAEAKKRFNFFKENPEINFNRKMEVNYVEENMSKNKLNSLENKLGKVEFDVISVQFGLEQIIKSQKIFENIINLTNKYLKSGGFFIFTCFDGKKVFEQLKDKEKLTFARENPETHNKRTVFEIEKKYTSSNALKPFGSEVVLHYHTFDGMKQEKINLLDLENLTEMTTNAGFTLVERKSFAQIYEGWMDKKKKKFLSTMEKEYSFLFDRFVFRKN
jgi:ubiquinone/menaquinone biosynthesis C-methylase UbiE